MRRLLLAVLLFSTFGFSQIDQITARTVIIKPQTAPVPVSQANVSRVGSAGNVTYFYWIVATFSAGNSSPAGPFLATQSNSTLSGSNYNSLSWTGVQGATTYDVLRTTTSASPTGACACAVATGVSTTSQTDQSNSLSAYTVNTLDPNSLNVSLTNNAGTLNANGASIGGGFTPPVVATQSANGATLEKFKRATDSAPTGFFTEDTTNAGADVFSVDVSGNVIANSITLGSGVGFADFTNGTLAAGVSGVVRFGANSNLASTSENAGSVLPLQVGGTFVNAGATGTLANGLVCDSSGAAISCPTSATTGVLGIAVAGAGTTGSAIVRSTGQLSCVFENTAVVGNWFIPGTGTRGNCRDSGTAGSSAAPTGAYGIALSAGTGSQTILYLGPQGGSASGVVTNPAATATNTILATADIVNLTLKQFSGGAASIFETRFNGGGTGFYIDANLAPVTQSQFNCNSASLCSLAEAGGGNWRFSFQGNTVDTFGSDVAGTNTAGNNTTLQAGNGTGNSVPAQLNLQTPGVRSTSDATSQTEVTRAGLGWTKNLTNNTVTTVTSVSDASNTSAAIIAHYAVEVFDGTNVQYEVGLVMCAINNKAGAFTQNACTKSGNTQGVTSGTLAVTWTITAANPALLQINSNSSLTTTTNRVTYNIENLTQQVVAIQ